MSSYNIYNGDLLQIWALLLLLREKMAVLIGGLLLWSYPLEMHSPVIRQKFTPFVGFENNMFETINLW